MTRGTTDQGYWVNLLATEKFKIDFNVTSLICCKFGHQMAPLQMSGNIYYWDSGTIGYCIYSPIFFTFTYILKYPRPLALCLSADLETVLTRNYCPLESLMKGQVHQHLILDHKSLLAQRPCHFPDSLENYFLLASERYYFHLEFDHHCALF